MEESVQVNTELHVCWTYQGTRINSDMYNSKPRLKSFLFCCKTALHTIKNKNCNWISKVWQPKFARVILSHGRIAIFRPLLSTPDYSTIIQNPVQAPPSPLFILPFALWMLWVRAACFTGSLVSQKAGCWSLDACRPAICATSYPS